MGEVYTFTRFPQAFCHLCNQHYKYIFGHIRGKKHKAKYNDYLSKRKTIDDYYKDREREPIVYEIKSSRSD